MNKCKPLSSPPRSSSLLMQLCPPPLLLRIPASSQTLFSTSCRISLCSLMFSSSRFRISSVSISLCCRKQRHTTG